MKMHVNIFRILIRFVGIFIGVNILIFSLMALTYAIPHLSKTSSSRTAMETILSEGIYKDGCDGWTDLLIYNSVYISAEHGESPYEMAFSNPVSYSTDPISRSELLLQDSRQYTNYTNYFVGVTGLLKILLSVMSYKMFRDIRLILFMILFVSTCIYLYRFTGGWKIVLAFLTTAIIGNFFNFMSCLTYSIDILIGLGAMLIVFILKQREYEKILQYSFFVIGILTFLMNYWSFPIYSLCLPLTLICIFETRSKKSVTYILMKCIKNALCWIVGYGTEVIFRLITAKTLFGSTNGLEHLAWYTQAGSKFDKGSRISALINMFDMFWTPHNIILFLISFILLIIAIRNRIVRIIKNRQIMNCLLKSIPFLLIAVIPLAWIIILYNHTHHGFDNYLLCMSAFPILSVFGINEEINEHVL